MQTYVPEGLFVTLESGIFFEKTDDMAIELFRENPEYRVDD